ncbi:MAG: response regulator, partial [Desulfobulbaceae bacterium]|nr:response regulator [Desulfobulbaceae bacterium]
QQAQKMEAVGTLAGGIAHDFNNILAIIMGFSELALLKLPEESNAKEDMKRVFDAGIRAREMIKQILTFSRQRKFELEPLYLHLVLKESLKLLRASIPSTIEIQEDIETKNDTVLADLTHMQQMIMNLVTNAYHAMREKGGVLSIRLFPVAMDPEKVEAQGLVLEPGKYLQLDVGDTGEGMGKRVMDRIFEPYFTTKDIGKGTGMGLAIVHGIVMNHGGDIAVESEPGKGTVFHVYLPLCEKSSVKEVEERQGDALPTGKESLLVVDDEEHLLEMEKQMLIGLGYKVTAMNDSEEALKRFIVTPDAFDLVITDMTMPHMNGVELVRKLFAVKPELPVILCTGYSELINEQKAKMLGIREYMMKPVVLEKMARVVRKALDEGKSYEDRSS